MLFRDKDVKLRNGVKFAIVGILSFVVGTIAVLLCMFAISNVDELFGEYKTAEKALYKYTLNFPLYSEIKELYIILDQNARVEQADAHENEKPVVFYGFSITQGGCASRPELFYSAIVSRNLNLEYLILVFPAVPWASVRWRNILRGLR